MSAIFLVLFIFNFSLARMYKIDQIDSKHIVMLKRFSFQINASLLNFLFLKEYKKKTIMVSRKNINQHSHF